MKRRVQLSELETLAKEGPTLSPQTLNFGDAIKIILLMTYMETGPGALNALRANPHYKHPPAASGEHALGAFGIMRGYRGGRGASINGLKTRGYDIDQIKGYSIKLAERYRLVYDDVELVLLTSILHMHGYAKTVLGFQKLYQCHNSGPAKSLAWYANPGTRGGETRTNFDRVGKFMSNHKVMNSWRILLER